MSIDHAPPSVADHHKESTTRDIIYTDSDGERRIVVVGAKPIPLNRGVEVLPDDGLTGEGLRKYIETVGRRDIASLTSHPILLTGEPNFYRDRRVKVMVFDKNDQGDLLRMRIQEILLGEIEANLAQFAILPAVHVKVGVAAGMEYLYSPEVQTPLEQWMSQARKALAERYERYGAKREDFISFEYTDENEKTWHVVAYAGEESIYLGSWDDIQADTEGHTVLIDGVKFDDRAMTEKLYRHLLAEMEWRGEPKAIDSKTFTWLTGEEQIGKLVPIMGEGSRCVDSTGWAFARSKLEFIGMRPILICQ